MFDPDTATVPLPSVMLLDPATGLLAVPQTDCSKLPEGLEKMQCPLTNEVAGGLGMLDGWPGSMAVTIPFDSKLDTSKIGDNVKVVDVTDPSSPQLLQASKYYAFFNKGLAPATVKPFLLTVKNRMDETCASQLLCMPWEYKKGSRWIAVAENGLTDESAKPILENPAFYLMTAKNPLVDAKGHPLVSIWDPQNPEDETTADMLENFRLIHKPVWDGLEAAGIAKREKAVAFAYFNVQSGPTAVFNPLPFGSELPSPIDWNGKAVKAPLNAEAVARFDLPLDETTITGDSIMLLKLAPSGPSPVSFTAAAASQPDSKGRYLLTIKPSNLLESKSSYAVILTDSIKGFSGTSIQQDLYFMLSKFQNPLVITWGGVKYPGSTFLDSALELLIGALKKSPVTASAKDWNDAYYDPLFGLIPNLESLEQFRTSYQAVFAISDALGLPRNKVILLWTFTTAD
jgi:hypothetical protein